MGGTGAHEGRLELYKLGHWGTVCNYNWDLADATVVCRQLGYNLASSLPTGAVYGQGSGVIWLYNATCIGNEEKLTDCNNSGVGVHYCSPSQDVSIQCSSKSKTDYMHACCNAVIIRPGKNTVTVQLHCSLFTKLDMTINQTVAEGSVRLIGKPGSGLHEGRVEVYYFGHWVRVCAQYWDIQDATVACHQLGYPTALTARVRGAYGRGRGLVLLDQVDCTGSEANISQCIASGARINSSGCSNDAGVICSG